MASGSNYLTTYYAKRIIGDTAAETATKALLQTGTGITNDIWILHRTNRANLYGIKYMYDDTTNGTADRIELYGGHQVSSVDTATAWVQLDTGDVYILGRVGINYDPSDNNNTYSLYVNGTTYVYGTTYLNDAVGIGYDPETGGNTYKLYVNGDIYGNNNFYLNGKMGIGYDPASSGNTYKLYVDGDTYFDDNTYLNGKVGIGYDPNTSGNAYKLYVNGTSYFNGDTTHNGIDYFANGTTYYINNSADSYLRDVKVRSLGIAQTDGTTGYGISLYNGPQTSAPTYGIMFAKTATYGTHGAVTSDWATYLTMSDTTNRGWIFRRGSTNVASIDGTGKIYLGYAANTNNPGIYWNPYVESASDASDVSRIIQVKSGVAGGTELQIYQANDTTDVINLVTPAYIYMNSKKAFTVSDGWLRINDGGGFSSGVYFGSSTVRTDGEFWSDSVRIVDNWVGFYNSVQGSTRYGYVQANADRMYFRKENGVSSYAFDFNGYIYTNSNIYATGTMYADGNMNAHSIWANRASGERQVGVDAGTTGTLYFYSNGTNKGIYSGSGYRTGAVLTINSSSTTFYGALSGNATSATYLKDRTNSTASYLNYGASGLAASAITWLCCWNGYEVRAISKAEMANAVGSYLKVNMSGTDRKLEIRMGTINVKHNTQTSVTFSPAFSNYCSAVIPWVAQLGFAAAQSVSVGSTSKTGCKLYQYNVAAVDCVLSYIAFGY